MTTFSPNQLDLEILTFLGRFIHARGPHVAGWTGATPWGARKRLRLLRDAGLVESIVLSVDLADPAGRVRASQAHTWRLTGRGARVLEEAGGAVTPFGYPNGTPAVVISRSRARRQMSDHILGVTGLAVAYRRAGVLDLVAEREVIALERPPRAGELAPAPPTWSVQPRGSRGIHPADLGIAVVDQAGTPRSVAVELERSAGRDVAEIADLLTAYRAAGMPVRWHVLRTSTIVCITEAAERIGDPFSAAGKGGYRVSRTGMVSVQPWRPERIGGGPSAWGDVLADPARVSTGLRLTPLADLAATWRQGAVIDVETGARTVAPAQVPTPTQAPGATTLPPMDERVRILQAATTRATSERWPAQAYKLGDHLVADWDGARFRSLRAA